MVAYFWGHPLIECQMVRLFFFTMLFYPSCDGSGIIFLYVTTAYFLASQCQSVFFRLAGWSHFFLHLYRNNVHAQKSPRSNIV